MLKYSRTDSNQIHRRQKRAATSKVVLTVKGQVIRATFSFNLPQHCCTASWTSCCRITTAGSTCHATNFTQQCCKLQQYVAQSRPEFYFWQQIFSTCSNEICCRVESWARGGNTGNPGRATTLFNLQCNSVTRQVETKCCPVLVGLYTFLSVSNPLSRSSVLNALQKRCIQNHAFAGKDTIWFISIFFSRTAASE